ncbi:MAG TPA: ABC transporter substrate-binding protein [Nitriliruptoraceae bacterium]|nr:ABC transporter substrate-binding protein [Nitriliruptoraceae bacterium]
MRAPTGVLSRRSFLRGVVATAALAGPLAACSRGSEATTLRFYQSKPEVVGYFDDNIIAPFNTSQDAIHVTHDATTSLVASLVRQDPHDLVCNNYDNMAGTFVARDVLTDLKDLPAAARVQPDVQELVGQYATADRATDVLPYSVTAAGVIYNEALFDEHGVQVPTTWSQMQAACETFQAVDGVTPIYMTLRDPWTIQQGLFDYTAGGMIDVAGFFADLQAAGPDGGTAGSVNFRDTFAPIVARMLQMLDYANSDAASRAYFDGNTAFAEGDVAMYFQGPWAIGEIFNANPDLPTRTFPLPATDVVEDLAARVNLDLALWIPAGAAHPEEAATFIEYLTQPEVQVTYNDDNLAFTPTVDAPPVQDERIAGLQAAIDEGRFYQGAGTYIPNSIPTGNYLQELVLSRNGDQFLETLDADWNRLAQRTQA